jgi:hypothetical protein
MNRGSLRSLAREVYWAFFKPLSRDFGDPMGDRRPIGERLSWDGGQAKGPHKLSGVLTIDIGDYIEMRKRKAPQWRRHGTRPARQELCIGPHSCAETSARHRSLVRGFRGTFETELP